MLFAITVMTSGNRLAHWRPLVAKGHHELICVHMCLCCLCVPSPVPHCDLCSHLFPIVCSHLSRVFVIVTSPYQLGYKFLANLCGPHRVVSVSSLCLARVQGLCPVQFSYCFLLRCAQASPLAARA